MLSVQCRLPLLMLSLLLSIFPVVANNAPAVKAAITETDLTQISVQHLQLGMDKAQAGLLLEQHFSNVRKTESGSVTAFKCVKQQCQAQRLAADGSVSVNVHFNQADKIYWIAAQTQTQLASSAEECMRLAGEQLAAIRLQYSPDNQQYFYGQNTLSLRLNKQGHPDPADNTLYGFRVQIKCDPLAKGLAQSEFELRDNAL
ncbi:hypothetical protein GCM10010919_12220 [Alishewanella longhuensis]|uniref:DUF2987 domain-containing protein n=1 Tax=Alishewanella longhuensis TaxID=1091037 RepID=A0ABQ3KW40_9ALTE|nr:hypothetical protein [Alishewanella longhuensis]GHG65106.1 hypothetical protein GCM10010919_12220 [Alishewanella longhuensis]